MTEEQVLDLAHRREALHRWLLHLAQNAGAYGVRLELQPAKEREGLEHWYEPPIEEPIIKSLGVDGRKWRVRIEEVRGIE